MKIVEASVCAVGSKNVFVFRIEYVVLKSNLSLTDPLCLGILRKPVPYLAISIDIVSVDIDKRAVFNRANNNLRGNGLRIYSCSRYSDGGHFSTKAF